MLTNQEIAARFGRIADVLEIQGENAFKVRAYRRAVEAIIELEDDLSAIVERDALGEIPGFGDAIVAKTNDFLKTGTTNLYERIKDAVPVGVVKMAAIGGVGPKTAKALWDGLAITDVEMLEKAAREERIRHVAGFGAAKEKSILEAIERNRRLRAQTPLYIALAHAERLLRGVTTILSVEEAAIAGDIRRGAATVSGIVIAVSSTAANEAAVRNAFDDLLAADLSLADAEIPTTLQIDEPKRWGSLLIRATGDTDHVELLQSLAGEQDFDLENCEGDEAEVYKRLGLSFVEPELRESTITVEAVHSLPVLVREADFRGQLHEHTTYSDGTASVQQMADAAIARGYEYLAITDHSQSLKIANGLNRERLIQQIAEIDTVNRELNGKLTLLKGIEADILQDGTIDCDDALLAQLDIVVASVHIRHKENSDQMTARIIRALENPRVNILGHPTGRLLGRREAYPVDMEAIIAAAKANDKVLEINASPERMDMDDKYARMAKVAGVLLTVNADAHSIAGLGLLPWGLFMARRAGLSSADVVNTFSLEKLRDALGK